MNVETMNMITTNTKMVHTKKLTLNKNNCIMMSKGLDLDSLVSQLDFPIPAKYRISRFNVSPIFNSCVVAVNMLIRRDKDVLLDAP